MAAAAGGGVNGGGERAPSLVCNHDQPIMPSAQSFTGLPREAEATTEARAARVAMIAGLWSTRVLLAQALPSGAPLASTSTFASSRACWECSLQAMQVKKRWSLLVCSFGPVVLVARMPCYVFAGRIRVACCMCVARHLPCPTVHIPHGC